MVSLGLVLGVAGNSVATQVNDATLSIPFSAGSGNSNQHFAIDTNSILGIEVGLKAKPRFLGDAIPVGNIYYVSTGYQASPTTYANWNFDWSLILGTSYQGYSVSFDYDIDPSTAINYSNLTSAATGPGGQDSWNYGMSFLGIVGFNANLNATYDIALSVLSATGAPVASSHIQVVVGDGGTQVPEPATMLLLGLGLMGIAGIRRKFKG